MLRGPGTALPLVVLLVGCVGGGTADVSRSATGGEVARVAADTQRRDEARSPVIDELVARRSVIPAGSGYARMADAVLAASQGSAVAQLRVNRLRAQARASSWLPSIGPSVSLTSLGSIAAGLLVQEVLMDNGRRKAERAAAAADVEVAAVAVAEEMNARVHDGIARHIEMERARAQGGVTARAIDRMERYKRIVDGRVAGGLSDRSEALLVAQKLAELRATLSRDREAEATARAELGALTAGRAPDIRGLTDLPPVPATATPLTVMRAGAEARRMIAQARAERADHLPGLIAGARLTGDGIKADVDLGARSMFGTGTRASLDALTATETLAAQKEAEARAETDRKRVALERQIAEMTARQTSGRALVGESAAVLALFDEQFTVGRRTLIEVVNLTETTARTERDQVGLGYDIALLRLRAALVQGVLVDGGRM